MQTDALPSSVSPPVRMIARLDVKGANVIKGVHLEGLRVIGQPEKLARKYYDEGADEIIFMDSVASLYERNNLLPVVAETARNVFIPVTVGGGIRKLEDIKAALRNGADKVAINTAAVERPSFLHEAAKAFGSQCIVLSIEAKQRSPDFWEVMTCNGREKTDMNVLDWVARAEELGVGEILLTSIDKEGTQSGFDIELIQSVRRKVRIPIIACGGAGSAAHVHHVIASTGITAVGSASLFHYELCPIPELKARLRNMGIGVRQ
ncbi:imidazole glycerol phosphate synthase subunit HisF (plasmid) [Azospirillum sp. TSA2s]|uniref:imidazole glycerol phosphate synthase subunit HisF n=1 Tax=Azospirillum sp. TSA2s TaxID=709810 RepID=UPI0010AAC806|nr:imidazole glycerol phosphate synthase cyclase subunit [Azospirillum sp. TSA2s]QCG93047.1 imidazole glycerol phosphate synthase subunit HisF [Azospirillum sp. TSA2s]